MSGLGGAPAAFPGVDAGRCRGGARDEDLVGAAGQPGHDLGDPGSVAWGRSLGCRPIWTTAAVKLGGRPFGELRPALAWRDDLGENGGALDGVRALPARQGTSRSAAVSVGRWDILPGRQRVPPYVAHRRFARRLSSSQRTTRAKARRSHSLPLLTYSAPGGLRQDPGRAAESAAGPTTDEDMGHDVRVLLSTDGRRGDEPLVGLAVRLRRWARRCACARRPTGRGEGSER